MSCCWFISVYFIRPNSLLGSCINQNSSNIPASPMSYLIHSFPAFNYHKAGENLNFGSTNTIKIARTINPAMYAYINILPHHPLPSVNFLRAPTLLCAASIPRSFLSSPEVAESRIVFSDSREAEKDCELLLSWEAIERRDAVKDSCSVRLCVKRASEVWEMEEPVVAESSSALSDRGARERSVDCGSGDSGDGGKSGVSDIAGCIGDGSVGANAGDVACSGEGVLDCGSTCEA
jgi:hypothetical protein